MKQETKYIKCLNLAEKIVNEYNFNDIKIKIKDISKEIENFKVKILFIGGFNAGKSALINTILKDEVLIEEQCPETTIATEIIYGSPSRVVLCDKEGNRVNVPIESIGSNDATKYFNYTYYLDNENLLKLNNYVIVDMPGFDSGIEAHNKALFQYLDEATVYLFVVDCEKGALSDSALNFINEIKNYENDIAFIVNKEDKKTPTELMKVKNFIQIQAKSLCNSEVNVITTSKYEEGSSQKIIDLINTFDKQSLFERKFKKNTVNILSDIEFALRSMIKASSFDNSQFDIEIEKKEKGRVILKEKISIERKKLKNNLQNVVKPQLISDIRNALEMNVEVLTSASISGNEAFSRTVNDILRPILISKTNEYIENSFSDFIGSISIESNLGDINVEGLQEILSSLVKKMSDNASKPKGGNSTFKGIATILAVTTSFVAPWLEIIIIFLPEILKVFGAMNENNQRDALKNRIRNEVIPNIIYKIGPSIDESLQMIEEEISRETERELENLIEIETSALDEIMKRKNEKIEEFDTFINGIEQHIISIETFKIEFLGGEIGE